MTISLTKKNDLSTAASHFQTLYSISSEKNHTIVFPLPIDVIGHMVGGGKEAKHEARHEARHEAKHEARQGPNSLAETEKKSL